MPDLYPKPPSCSCRLMLDPYARIAYDYFGGIEDIRKAKVCMYLTTSVVSYITFAKQQFETL